MVDFIEHLSPRQGVRRCVLVAVSLLLVGTACDSADDAGGSNTPRVTVDESGSDSSRFLLDVDVVRDIGGLEDVVAQEIKDLPVFENPDPRGPCGGVVPQLPIDGAVGRAFTAPSTSAIQLVADESPVRREYLAALVADRRDGCDSYTSTTNRGDLQTVSDIRFLDAAELPDGAVAWISRIDVTGGTLYGGAAFALVDGHMVALQIQSMAPVQPATLQQLVERAAAQLSS